MDRTGLILDAERLDDIASLAAAAECSGFDSVWATELYRTSFQQLAAAAHSTHTIRLGTAVALAFVRSPLVTALTALDLDELSGGRLILGLGSGARRSNERWHGVPFGRPVAKITECIEAVRLIASQAHTGERISFKGEFYDIDLRGWKRPFKPVRPAIPLFLAGVGPRMTEAAARVADGYLGHVVCSLDYLRQVTVPALARGLERSGRSRSDFTVATIVTCAVADDVAAAREAARRTIAFYATVRTYEPPFRLHGFLEQCRAVREAFMRGDVEGMAAAVTDEMVDAMSVVGTADHCRGVIARYRELVDLPILSAPHYFLDFAEVKRYQDAILEAFGR